MGTSYTIAANNPYVMTWTLTDASGNPINDATMTATLYTGRSRLNPEGIPGTPVSALTNVSLTYVALSLGQYSATLPATSLDLPLGGGYTFVLDASVSGTAIYHSEPSVVIISNQE